MYSAHFLSAAQREALGALAVESAALEYTVNLALTILTDLDAHQASVMFEGRMLGWKLDALKAIGLERLTTEVKRRAFSQLIGTLKSLNGERTVAIHGQWQPAGGVRLGELFAGADPATRPAEATIARDGKVRKLKAGRLHEIANGLSDGEVSLGRFVMEEFWVMPNARRHYRRRKKSDTPPASSG